MSYFFALLCPAIILAFCNVRWFYTEKDILTYTKNFINFFLFFNIFCLGIYKFVLGKVYIADPRVYTLMLTIKYVLSSIILGFIYLIVKGFLQKHLTYSEVTYKHKKINFLCLFFGVLFIGLGATLFSFTNYFVETFGNITPEQFLYTITTPLNGTGEGFAEEIISGPILSILFIFVLFCFPLCIKKTIFLNDRKIFNRDVNIKIFFPVAAAFLIFGMVYCSNKLKLNQIFKAYTTSSTGYLEQNYKDPRKVQLSFPEKKRNVIHIYLESIENSYFSRDLGGYMDTNLMPELAELSQEGISFSHNQQFGGPEQTFGSSWSAASMINMGCGIPLIPEKPEGIPGWSADYGTNGSFFPGIVGLGDILEAQGYEQTIMFGADADFAGLSTYFTQHGNFNIFDYKYAKQQGLIPQDYKVWWGYEDDKLYEYAKMEVTRLAQSGKPFNFVMETADTHYPDGYLSPHAQKLYDKQYANVIRYSTQEAVQFIRWIQQQPFYENTTIIVTGDHWSMDTNFFAGWDPAYRRSIFNLILNPACDTSHAKTKNREYAPLDFFPTILASMGVQIQGERLGLGTNLFSTYPTLIERDGLDKFNEELSLAINSPFFNEEFINEKKTSEMNPENLKTYS